MPSLSATSILENDTTTLSGTFTDPGTLDTHTVTIGWGDGSAPTILSLPAGTIELLRSPPVPEQPGRASTPARSRSACRSADKDGGVGTAAASVTVADVAPTVIIQATVGEHRQPRRADRRRHRPGHARRPERSSGRSRRTACPTPRAPARRSASRAGPARPIRCTATAYRRRRRDGHRQLADHRRGVGRQRDQHRPERRRRGQRHRQRDGPRQLRRAGNEIIAFGGT